MPLKKNWTCSFTLHITKCKYTKKDSYLSIASKVSPLQTDLQDLGHKSNSFPPYFLATKQLCVMNSYRRVLSLLSNIIKKNFKKYTQYFIFIKDSLHSARINGGISTAIMHWLTYCCWYPISCKKKMLAQPWCSPDVNPCGFSVL